MKTTNAGCNRRYSPRSIRADATLLRWSDTGPGKAGPHGFERRLSQSPRADGLGNNDHKLPAKLAIFAVEKIANGLPASLIGLALALALDSVLIGVGEGCGILDAAFGAAIREPWFVGL